VFFHCGDAAEALARGELSVNKQCKKSACAAAIRAEVAVVPERGRGVEGQRAQPFGHGQTMTTTVPAGESLAGRGSCCVVIVYDDAAMRARAMAACDCLIQQCWAEVEFDFQWWRTDFLADPQMAEVAAEQAANADFVIVGCDPHTEFSPALRQWFETWAARRGGRDGALLNLTSEWASTAAGWRNEQFLRQIARQAFLDYLTPAEPFEGELPASFEEAERRANRHSSILDDILNQPPRPPSFGLND
jgi:hypothetical protein